MNSTITDLFLYYFAFLKIRKKKMNRRLLNYSSEIIAFLVDIGLDSGEISQKILHLLT